MWKPTRSARIREGVPRCFRHWMSPKRAEFGHAPMVRQDHGLGFGALGEFGHIRAYGRTWFWHNAMKGRCLLGNRWFFRCFFGGTPANGGGRVSHWNPWNSDLNQVQSCSHADAFHFLMQKHFQDDNKESSDSVTWPVTRGISWIFLKLSNWTSAWFGGLIASTGRPTVCVFCLQTGFRMF